MTVSAFFSLLTVLAAGMLLAAAEADAQHGGNPTRFEKEGRDEWQKPDQVVDVLDIKPGMVVADIGSASGYFSRRFSKAVGPGGRVLAVDVDTDALAWLADKAKEMGLTNIDTVHADTDSPHLPDGGVDLVFFCNVLHHIGGRVEYLRNLKAALKPGGRVAIVDYYKKSLPVGPQDPAHKLSWEETYNTLREAGYRTVREPQLLPYQYFIIVTPQ